MNSKVKAAMAATTALLVAIAMATPANAAPTAKPDRASEGLAIAAVVASADDPHAAYEALSPTDKALVLYVTQPVGEPSLSEGPLVPTDSAAAMSLVTAAGEPVAAAASGCWAKTKTWEQKALGGNLLYRWWQSLTWCGNGSSITSYSMTDRGGEVTTLFWSYEGAYGQATSNVGWEIRSRTQEHFKDTIVYEIRNTYPCGQIRGGASGLVTESTNCPL